MKCYKVDCLEKMSERVKTLDSIVKAEKELNNLEEDIVEVELNKRSIGEFWKRFKALSKRVEALEDLYFDK